MRRRGNAELRRLFEADQRDRSGDIREVDWDRLRDRDRQRRRRVEALIAGGALRRGPHAEGNVPPLAESLARAEQMTRERPPGPDPRP